LDLRGAVHDLVVPGLPVETPDRRVIIQRALLDLVKSLDVARAQIEDFVSAFTDYAIATYETRLNKYKGQTLKVTGSLARAPDDVVVNADVVNPGNNNAQPIKVGFRVRKTADGRPIVTDIQVEGVWLALSERSDFTGFLQQHNGSLAALTQLLKAQTQQMRNSAA